MQCILRSMLCEHRNISVFSHKQNTHGDTLLWTKKKNLASSYWFYWNLILIIYVGISTVFLLDVSNEWWLWKWKFCLDICLPLCAIEAGWVEGSQRVNAQSVQPHYSLGKQTQTECMSRRPPSLTGRVKWPGRGHRTHPRHAMVPMDHRFGG